MDFTTLLFLFAFLPSFIFLWLVVKAEYRLVLIFILNFGFILIGQSTSLLPLVLIAVIGYGIGRTLDSMNAQGKNTSLLMWIGICLAVLLLIGQKILVGYDLNGNPGKSSSLLDIFPLLGMSYITFQIISYIVDVSRGIISSEHNVFKFISYVLFFPKIVSGPIMRYKPFELQFSNLSPTWDKTAMGLRRVLIGVVKRLLLANQLGVVADAVFNLQTPNIGPLFAWLALIAYTFQIYFDFSGYTDIALGLGGIIGITLPENFNYPYTAQSISDFWRRWHITLSSWFREYVFYPLERRRTIFNGQKTNLFIVFLLTGLWHGLTLNYLMWGGIHGLAIVSESASSWQKSIWRPLRHITTFLVIMFGWVFFRSPTLEFAFAFIGRLFGNEKGISLQAFSQTTPLPFIEPSFLVLLAIAALFSMPIVNVWTKIRQHFENINQMYLIPFQVFEDAIVVVLFLLSVGSQLSGSFHPSIYATF
ncbi:MAG: MBOAT family O-acyltransferase [Anaerolineales bacterium]